MSETGMEGITDEDAAAEKSIPSVCGGYEPKYNTISLCKRAIAEGVPGDFAEVGVCGGTHPALMAYVSRRYGGSSRRVHLFDSFAKGFSKERIHNAADLASVSPEDAAKCEPSGEVMTSIEQVQQNMQRWGIPSAMLSYYEGYAQEVLPKVVDSVPQLAVLRMDVDFYSPTVAIYEYLYDKVSPGGYLISDDWGEYELDHPEASGCRMAAFRFFDKRGLPRPEVTRVASGTCWWRKP